MTRSIDYRTCRSCRGVIQKPVTLIGKFPELFKLPEPQPDPYRWATADAAETTSCDTAGQAAAHSPAAPAECVMDDDSGQCVNYAADHANGPNLHACPAAAAVRPGAAPGVARARAATRKRSIRDWSYRGGARDLPAWPERPAPVPAVAGDRVPGAMVMSVVRSLLAAVTGLAAASFAGGCWYLAGKLRAEALAVGPAPATPAYDDAQFVGLSPGQARLRANGVQPGLFTAGLYGIAWPGGTGQLGDCAAVSGDVVTRPLTVTSGPAPEAGQPASLDRSFFLGDPQAALGIPARDVVVAGPLGPLPAWYFPGRSSTFVIGVHGQNGTRRDLLRVIDIVHRAGFPALAVTYRNDRGAARDPSGYHRYGQAEWPDLEAAVRWSLAQGARSVVLVGQSMGGSIVAAFLGRSPLAARVARVVLDAPMLDLHAAVYYQVDRRLGPAVRRLPAPLVWAAERVASARFGVDWRATSYLRDTAWLKVPALVTHGDDDARVPVSTSARLRELEPALVTLERFPGAGHLESWNTDRSRYTALVEEFLAPAAS